MFSEMGFSSIYSIEIQNMRARQLEGMEIPQ